MSQIIFEVQTALFNALTSSAALTAVCNKIIDKPGDNENYPYICLEETNDIPANRHGYLGFDIFFSFGIYTQPGQLGMYPSKQIRGIMDSIINMKKFDLETDSNKMRVCKFFSGDEFQNNDVYGQIVTYEVIAHETVLNSY